MLRDCSSAVTAAPSTCYITVYQYNETLRLHTELIMAHQPIMLLSVNCINNVTCLFTAIRIHTLHSWFEPKISELHPDTEALYRTLIDIAQFITYISESFLNFVLICPKCYHEIEKNLVLTVQDLAILIIGQAIFIALLIVNCISWSMV